MRCAALGGTIKVFISGEESTDKFKAVIKSGNEEMVAEVSQNGDINYTYKVDSTASYTVSIVNLTSNTIHVSGSIIVNQ